MPLRKVRGNGFQDGLRVFENLEIPEAKHSDAPLHKKFSAYSVMTQSAVGVVTTTIKLDGKGGFVTVKIKVIRLDRMLSTEFPTAHASVAKQRPEKLLGVGLFSTKLASEGQDLGVKRRVRPFYPRTLSRPSATLSRGERVLGSFSLREKVPAAAGG